MTKMNYAERCKKQGIKLDLTPHTARDCWKKKIDGTTYYFGGKGSLQTKHGYEQAVVEYHEKKRELEDEKERNRPNIETWRHTIDTFKAVQSWYDNNPTPSNETTIAKGVTEFVNFVVDQFNKHGEQRLPNRVNGLGTFCKRHPAFCNEFNPHRDGYMSLGAAHYTLPVLWQRRLEDTKPIKEPQSFEYWVEKYLTHTDERAGHFTKDDTASNRHHTLSNFREYLKANGLERSPVSIADIEFYEAYCKVLDKHVSDKTGKELSKASKESYAKGVRMFLTWAGKRKACKYTAPDFASNERSFREPKGTGRKRLEKKALLWSPDDFKTMLDALPSERRCYILIMLNCGFRATDLSNLRHVDLHLDDNRIVIQREKINQNDSTPVISYPLWQSTVEAIKENMTDPDESDYVFLTRTGKQLAPSHALDSIGGWWRKPYNKKKYNISKQLDQLRKTGATKVSEIGEGLQDYYLGEALSTTAKKNYVFKDGEPLQRLDDAIAALGYEFGQVADEPTRKVELSDEMLETLKKAGYQI